MTSSTVPTYRPTWAEIDLAAIRHNYAKVTEIVGPTTKILVAVKSNAYGHGILEVARTLSDCDVDYLGVSSVDEAIVLRKAKIRVPILVLSAILNHEAEAILQHKITQTVPSLEVARRLHRAAQASKRRATIHLKIDTGMGRLGIWMDEALEFIRQVARLRSLFIEGIYTHLPVADEDPHFTAQQIRHFQALLTQTERLGIQIPLRHIANSMGLIAFRESHCNLVRPGLMIYGLSPKPGLNGQLGLKPVLSFKTRIVFLKKTPPGRSISYGRTHITKRPTLIATLPVGYGDGYSRIFSNRAEVLIRGQRAPVVGRVCMDHTMVDCGHIPGVRLGDEVVLIGQQGKAQVSAEELAERAGTIPYEIVCWLSPRVPRVYI